MSKAPEQAMSGSAQPMEGAMLWGTILVLGMANFMAVLDMTIVNVAVPHIAGSLGRVAEPGHLGHHLLCRGRGDHRAADRLAGRALRRGARVRDIGMPAFGLFSVLCGFAPSLGALVVFRILQGLAGGPLMPMSQTLILRIVAAAPDAAWRTGLWTMTTILAPIAGPLLGGIIADGAGWPWAFYINVPTGGRSAPYRPGTCSPAARPRRESKPVDYVGLGLLILWVGALQMMLDNGQEKDWFASGEIITLCVVAVVGFVAFLIWELTEKHPIVDLRVFRHRGFAAASIAMALTFGAFFASIVLIPLWLQTRHGLHGGLGRLCDRVQRRARPRRGADRRDPLDQGRSAQNDHDGALVARRDDHGARDLHPGYGGRPADPAAARAGTGHAVLHDPDDGHVDGLREPGRDGLGGRADQLPALNGGRLRHRHCDDGLAERDGNAATPNSPASSISRTAVLAQFRALGMSAAQALEALNNMVQGQAVMLATNHVFLVTGLFVAGAAAAIWLAPRPAGPIELGPSH